MLPPITPLYTHCQVETVNVPIMGHVKAWQCDGALQVTMGYDPHTKLWTAYFIRDKDSYSSHSYRKTNKFVKRHWASETK